MAFEKINAPVRPEFEGQIVSFTDYRGGPRMYDVAVWNRKYGWLEWRAIDEPTEEQKRQAMRV